MSRKPPTPSRLFQKESHLYERKREKLMCVDERFPDSNSTLRNDQPVSRNTGALPVCNNPTINPKRPIAEAKISITNIFTNNAEFSASAKAAPLPVVPTAIPQTKLHNPTVKPPQNKAYP